MSNPRSRTREFQRVINWAGNGHYAIAIARATVAALLALAAIAAVLAMTGALVIRARIASAGPWRLVSTSVLWAGAFAAPPLYLVRRDGQLYFGGTRGLVPDTFFSLIDGSFYGIRYHANQTQLAFIVLLVTGAAFAALALIAPRRDARRLLALMGIVSASLVAQRWLLGTVYLMGRTALLFIPLYLLFLIFSCESLNTRGRVGRIAGTFILFAAVALSAWHFARAANLQYALDWRDDAATKTMMADVEREIAGSQRTVLGVEWTYAPVAAYYARRHDPVDVEVVIAPYDRTIDFLYLSQRHAREAHVVKTYPLAGAVLARP